MQNSCLIITVYVLLGYGLYTTNKTLEHMRDRTAQMITASFSELRRIQRSLERLIEADREDQAEPPLGKTALDEVWTALEAVDKALDKLGAA